MDAVFSFLFGTRTGFAILFAGGILLFAIIAFVMEKRTHKMYVDRGPKSEDEEEGDCGQKVGPSGPVWSPHDIQ